MADIAAKKYFSLIADPTGPLPSFPPSFEEPQNPINPPGIPLAHDPVTIGTPANGLSLSGQQLSLGLASSIQAGALSPEDFQKLQDLEPPAPQEGIVTRGTIIFDSPTSVDIDGYEWNYEGVLQEGGLEENKTIPGTPTEFNRIDALVGDNAGNYYWIEGTEDENQVLEPAIPTDRRLLEYILRTPAGDNTLEPVTPDLTIYVDKVSTGNQTIQSDLTIAKFARPTYSRNRIEADVNGKLRRVDDEDLFSGNHSDLNLNDGTNPHGTTKSDLGLGNVDNTSDLNKPISNATQTVLNQKANSSDLAEVAISGDYEDLINTPEPFFDLDFTWDFDGNKTYAFPSAFDLVRINWVSLYGIILPKDNIAYTVNPTTKTLTLGSLYTPSLGDKLVISSRLINV